MDNMWLKRFSENLFHTLYTREIPVEIAQLWSKSNIAIISCYLIKIGGAQCVRTNYIFVDSPKFSRKWQASVWEWNWNKNAVGVGDESIWFSRVIQERF